MRTGWALLLVVVATGCGGGSKQSLPEKPPPALASRCGDDARGVDAKPVWFRASDGALLDGASVGDGDVGVVLAHESPSDLCPWLPYAQSLAGFGYRAFAFDFRGSGSSPARFGAEATRYDLDVEAAAAELRRQGAKKVFLVGGSLGGAAVMAASSSIDPQPAGVISMSGEPELVDAMKAAPKMKAPLLVLVARDDSLVSVADSRKLIGAAGSADKQLAVFPGNRHGWDLVYRAPYRARVNALVFAFLSKHSQ
jgi:dienelactone hydrolase